MGSHHSLLAPDSYKIELHSRLGNPEGHKEHFRVKHSLNIADWC